MAACGACGAALQGSPRFCPECGASQSPPDAGPRLGRKTVTILFSDLVGSTAIGERHDPEQVRAVLERYFGAMRTVIEGHGGTVEKYIGDAIMAVFGIPVLHEDDALRAVRAAADMHASLAELNAELGARGAPRIEIRTGVNSGEVVTGSEGSPTLVTGDAVNSAARLEQAAGPGHILMGELTWQLVRHAVDAAPAARIAAKGKTDPVVAYRLLRVLVPGSSRQSWSGRAPLIGRDAELAELRVRWSEIVEAREPGICLVLGSPGVGKSRLVDEFASDLGGAAVLRGTCLPYGDGITYWPLAEVVRSAAGLGESESSIAARAKLAELLDGEPDARAIGARLAEAIGIEPGGSPQPEIFWAVRRTLQWIARQRALVVVWDDLQWAEPTFVDLVRHLATELRESPILLLVMARTELLEGDPGWATDVGAAVISLEPLGADAANNLISELPGGAALPSLLRGRIAGAAEGNPLFVEEMLAMLVDDGRLKHGDDGWRAAGDLRDVGVPPTITALLAARIDRLSRDERVVAERASVVGRSFESGAVVGLSPETDRLTIADRLLSLARRQIIEAEAAAGIDGGDAHRFRHLLIRDAAYAALPKAERARLHEALADWLEAVVGERIGEFAELVAFHLVEAHRYHLELGVPPATVEPIGRRAAARFTESARQAAGRGDDAGALALRRRALDLPMPPTDRVDLLVHQARGYTDAGALDDAAALLDQAEVEAETIGSEALDMRILVGRGFVETARADGTGADSIVADGERAAAILESHGDASGVARAMDLVAHASFFAGHYDRAGRAWRSAGEWATRSGDRAVEARILPLLPGTANYGWTTKSEAIAYCRQLADAHPDSPMLQARALSIMALLHAHRGDLDVAVMRRDESREALAELGVPWMRVELQSDFAEVEIHRGDWAAAEAIMIEAHELAMEVGWREATISLYLIEIYYEQGRLAEAKWWLAVAAASAQADEPSAKSLVKSWRGLIAAREGDRSTAIVAVGGPLPDFLEPESRADILKLRGRARALLGDHARARDHLTAAAEIYRRKEAFLYLDQVTEWIRQLPADPPPGERPSQR